MKIQMLCLLAGLTIVGCQGVQGPNFAKTQYRVAGSASYNTLEADFGGPGKLEVDTLSFNGQFGYFVDPNVEVGLQAQYTDADVKFTPGPASVSLTMYGILPYARYWFMNTGNTRPWVQGRVGLIQNETLVGPGADSGFAWGVTGGLSTYVTESTAFEWFLDYLSYSADNGPISADVTGFTVGGGYAVHF
ncbi:MAG TPA: outer membrane beta-barrel protein [Planctomycetota bacterium]